MTAQITGKTATQTAPKTTPQNHRATPTSHRSYHWLCAKTAEPLNGPAHLYLPDGQRLFGFTEGGNTLFIQAGFGDGSNAPSLPLKHTPPEWTRNAIIDDAAIATLVATRTITTDSLKYLQRSSIVVDLLMVVANQLFPGLESRMQLTLDRDTYTQVIDSIKLVSGPAYRSSDSFHTLDASRRALIKNAPNLPEPIKSTPDRRRPVSSFQPVKPVKAETFEQFAMEALYPHPSKQETSS